MKLIGKGRHTNTSSLLNIAGLTAAFAALYIILVQVHHDFSFNRNIKESDRIYMVLLKDWMVEGRYMDWMSRPIGESLVNEVPGVESGGTAVLSGLDGEIYNDDGQRVSTKVGYMSEGARRMFGFEAVSGSWEDWIGDSTYAVSESTARKLGLQAGDSFKIRVATGVAAIGIPDDATVAVIYRNPPADSDLNSFEMFTNLGDSSLGDWSDWSYPYFVKLQNGVTTADFEEAAVKKMIDYMMAVYGAYGEDDIEQLTPHLVCIRDTYFDDTITTASSQGNAVTTWTLLVIAILVVLIAFINYVNFFFAQIPVRLREVNTRRIFGCSRGRLVLSLVLESVTMVAVSLVLGAVAVTLFGHSPLAGLIGASTAIGSNVWIALLTVALGVVISVAASLYPALFITSFNTAFALKGTLGSAAKGKRFRTTLIGFQFVVSIVLIICTLFINMQRSWMLRRDMGFDKEQVWCVAVSWQVGSSREAVESSLRSDPAVKDVTWADGRMITDSRMGWGRAINDRECHWQCYPVATNFLKFMGIEIVDGRDFTDSDRYCESGVAIFNEAARDEFGLGPGMHFQGHVDDRAEIVGICRNFNYSALRNVVGPFSFYVFGKNEWRPLAHLFIRSEAGIDVRAFTARVKDMLHQFEPRISPDDFDLQLLDSELYAQYTRETNLSTLVTLFTLLAVVISLMGVFGLVMFETEYRRKEIGIRRVNGATVTEILEMFNSRFVRIVAVCFLIAVPLSLWIVNRYLENYAYRIPLYWWVFAVALLAVSAVTVSVVTVRSWNAATANPVDSLKSE